MFQVSQPSPKVWLIRYDGSRKGHASLQDLVDSKPLRWFKERLFKIGQTKKYVRPFYSSLPFDWWNPDHHPEKGDYRIVTCNDKTVPLEYVEQLARDPQYRHSYWPSHNSGSKRLHHKKSRSPYRHMRTQAERRAQGRFFADQAEADLAVYESETLYGYCPPIKGRHRYLRNNYDDVPRRDVYRSWKSYRKTQYRVKDLAVPPFFNKVKIPFRGRFVEYRSRYEDFSRTR